ncbi:uncharacterized protein VICG_00016 [Vittaforma corneae ATCC 50505]|uniref:Uncharacterized protein n=1 Tax=Vittaforma corneae (strain ATCC 50505) TaxID=993615 RepID=L2GPE6_VITCO|nr:uncharacterized protein VICG_00016 [Vittaforma corneae ATCC 50505]ELA42701.1 hypothetical protein VICG_00016 [Vittaforma corneae ATCC 50505]
MLREQLEELQRTKRTLLHTKNALIRFVLDEDVDSLTLFNNLPFPTSFTTQKSLSFDRHTLSEKEEKRFNSRFAPFLRNLISKSKHPGIDILLEYLMRIYCIDTFNPQELTFLLLPFKKYFNQLQIIAKNTKNQFSSLKSYSISSISRIIVKDKRLMLDFVKYFNAYEVLKEFLDKTMDEIIDILKASDMDYLSEIYKIMELLIQHGNPLKALQIYHRMRSYLNTDDFILLLLPYFPKDLIEMKDHKESGNKYQMIFNNKGGRSLLKNQIEIYRYLEYLLSCGLIPDEFNDSEYKTLQHIFFGKPVDQIVEGIHSNKVADNLIELFKEIEPKDELLSFIVRNNIQRYFAEHLSDKDKVYLIREAFDVNYLTPNNYNLCIMNLNKDVFKSKYNQILNRCLHFRTFNPVYFSKLIDFDFNEIFSCHSPQASTYKQNVIKLLERKNINLSDTFFNNNLLGDSSVLSYLLENGQSFSEEQLFAIIENTKILKSPSIVAKLLYYILRNFEKLSSRFNFNDFVSWLINNDFLSTLISIINVCTENHFSNIDTDVLYMLFLESAMSSSGDTLISILKILSQRGFNVVGRLYDSKNYEIILKIANLTELSNVLTSHVNTPDFIKNYYGRISDQHALVAFVISNSQHRNYLFLLAYFIDILITFRTHHSWNVVKLVLIECLSEKRQLQKALEYVLSHFDLFDDSDGDLFQKIFSGDVVFDIKRIETILCHESAAATLIHSCLLLSKDAEMLPILPHIVPLLIKYKKDTVIQLFKRYGNVMVTYIKDILQHYPEISHILLDLEPKFVLKELCSSLTIQNIDILLKILKTKTCCSSDVFKRLCACFNKHVGSLITSEHILALIRFFKNSRSSDYMAGSMLKEVESALSDFLVNVYIANSTIFYETMLDGVGMSSSLFADSANLTLQNISGEVFETNKNISNDLKFLCHFLEYNHITTENTMALYEQVFNARNCLSPRLISYLIRDDSQVLGECIGHLLSHINNDLDTIYILEILSHIFSNVPESKEFKNKILPCIFVLSEDENRLVSEKARQIIETLQ